MKRTITALFLFLVTASLHGAAHIPTAASASAEASVLTYTMHDIEALAIKVALQVSELPDFAAAPFIMHDVMRRFGFYRRIIESDKAIDATMKSFSLTERDAFFMYADKELADIAMHFLFVIPEENESGDE